ncbi:hypothetical protein [Mycobacterium sp. RTGN5]|uniref:hypothetical protein n=1 Tax=Mycobacterium sp. RTGN5 TaxID=3016522 RepID=UPI0029C653F3|nr:hypothetical protein [Mycobacterium sp. RTGN5]
MRTTLIHLNAILLAAVAAGAIAAAPSAHAGPLPVLCVMGNPCQSHVNAEVVNWNGGSR